MKTSLILISIFFTLLFTSASYAQVGWTETSNIFDLRVFAGRSVSAQAVNNTNMSAACPLALSHFQLTNFVVDTESPLFEETYSLLLTAQATGRGVQLYRTGECVNNTFALVNGARLRNPIE